MNREARSQATPPPPPRTSSLPTKANVVSEKTSAEPASHNQDVRYDSPTFTSFGYTASGGRKKKTVAEEVKSRSRR